MMNTITLSREEADEARRALSVHVLDAGECRAYESRFDDGKVMCVHLRGCGNEPAWTEACLLDGDESVADSPAYDELFMVWRIEHDGTVYELEVKAED